MRISLEEAARWVAEYEASGLEHRKFADAHGLHYGCIDRYRRRIRRAENTLATPTVFHELPSSFSAPLMGLPSSAHAVCVVLPNGYRVEISPEQIVGESGVAVLVQELAAQQKQGGV